MDNNNLKAFLECPICTVVPRKMQIFTCLNGHDICEHCFGSLGRVVCPQGDCSYGVPGSKKVRARKLEMMIENAEFELNCRYSKAGCLVEGLRKDLDEHEGDCSFRTVPCVFHNLGCDDKVCLRMLDNHLSQKHTLGQVVRRQEDWNFVILRFRGWELQRVQDGTAAASNKLGRVQSFQFDDGGGKVYANFAVNDKMLISWLTLVCSQTEAKDCIGTIRLSHPSAKNYHYEMQCPVTSIDSPLTMENGNYLAVTEPCLRRTLDSTEQDDVQFVRVAFKIKTTQG